MSNVDDTLAFTAECEKLSKQLNELLDGKEPDVIFFVLAMEYLKSYPAYYESVNGNVPGSPVDFLLHVKESMNKNDN